MIIMPKEYPGSHKLLPKSERGIQIEQSRGRTFASSTGDFFPG
jgi:hypothetical protein